MYVLCPKGLVLMIFLYLMPTQWKIFIKEHFGIDIMSYQFLLELSSGKLDAGVFSLKNEFKLKTCAAG